MYLFRINAKYRLKYRLYLRVLQCRTRYGRSAQTSDVGPAGHLGTAALGCGRPGAEQPGEATVLADLLPVPGAEAEPAPLLSVSWPAGLPWSLRFRVAREHRGDRGPSVRMNLQGFDCV